MATTYDTSVSDVADAVSTRTTAMTVTSTGSRILLVFASSSNTGTPANTPVTSVTYASKNLIKIKTASYSSGRQLECWGIINPASGANNIVVNWTGSCDIAVAGISFHSANENLNDALFWAAANTDASGTSHSVSLVDPLPTGAAVVVGGYMSGSDPTVAGGGTQRQEALNAGAHYMHVATYPGTNSSASWTSAGSAPTGMIAIRLPGAGTGKNRFNVS